MEINEKIKISLDEIHSNGSNPEESLREYVQLLQNLYEGGLIDSQFLSYSLADLSKFKHLVHTNVALFEKIVENAGILELPPSQVAHRGINRQEKLNDLLKDVGAYIGL